MTVIFRIHFSTATRPKKTIRKSFLLCLSLYLNVASFHGISSSREQADLPLRFKEMFTNFEPSLNISKWAKCKTSERWTWIDHFDTFKNHKDWQERLQVCLLLKGHLQKANCSASQRIWARGIKTSSQVFFFFFVFLCILQLQNGYVKFAQWRDAMTFSWMPRTKSKRPTICWVPAWRHLIPIPLMRHYRWNASRHHNPPKLALGLSDFSFHFNVFKKNYIYHSKLWRVGFFLILGYLR